MTYQLFYDQVLNELLSGSFHDGINLLVGMLDHAHQDPATLTLAQSELGGHELSAFLGQDPLYCATQPTVKRMDALYDLLCELNLSGDVSTTGRRLFDVTRNLTFARAIRERRASTTQKLMRAWQSGQKICVLGHGQVCALQVLSGQDLSNVTIVSDDPASFSNMRQTLGASVALVENEPVAFLEQAGANGQRFDLICASEVPDQIKPQDLGPLLARVRGSLSKSGKLIFASFVPQHLGAGWHAICLGWTLNCYLEGQWSALSDQARLSVHTCRDATNSVVWSAFSRISDDASWGANGYGH
jgi:hypothetical protein